MTSILAAASVVAPDEPMASPTGSLPPLRKRPETKKREKWLQAPAKVPAHWPGGKVVVLEFWATWCGPCVAAIPHLNELAEQFKDKPVQFIAVTDEKANVVQSFLQKTPIKAWIGLTADKMFGENNPYRVYAIPHTVIIDAHRRIAAVVQPEAVNAELIERCLAGKPLVPADATAATVSPQGQLELSQDLGSCPAPGVVPGHHLIGRTPMFQVMIRPHATRKPAVPSGSATSAQPTETTVMRWSKNPCALSMPGGQLRDAIYGVFEIDRTRLVLEAKLPSESYDFYVSLPPANLRHKGRILETVFAQAVQATFELALTREMREVQVLLLKTNAASAGKLAQSSSSGREEINGFGEVTGSNRTLGDLAQGLQNAVSKPVLDETGNTNRYSFSLQWKQKNSDHPNLKGMTAAVEQLGLTLMPAKRSLELVVVRAAAK